jgi:hypothetical protein
MYNIYACLHTDLTYVVKQREYTYLRLIAIMFSGDTDFMFLERFFLKL